MLGTVICMLVLVPDVTAGYDGQGTNVGHATSYGDSIQFEKYLSLSNEWSYRDSAKAEHYLDKARKVAGKDISPYQQGLLHHFKANILFDFDLEKAKQEYMRADSLLEQVVFPRSYYYRAKLWHNYGSILQRQDSSIQFMDIIVDRIIPYARMAGDSLQVGMQFYNIGLLMGNIDEYEKAADYFDKSIHAFRTIREANEQRLMVYSISAKNHILKSDLVQARMHLDSAAHYLQFVTDSMYESYYHTVNGTYYRYKKEKQNALFSFEKAMAIAKVLNDKYDLKNIYYEMFVLYRDFGEYSKAKFYLLKYEEYNFDRISRNQAIMHREMANLEFQLGNFKDAYREMEAYTVIQDSLYSTNRAKEILDLEKKYRLVEHENEILKLQRVNQEQQAAITRVKWWQGVSIGAIIFTLAIAYFAWRLHQSKKIAIAQREKLHQEEMKSVRQRERMNQYDAILKGQELERNRLARDLHDGLGGLLAGVKLKLSSVGLAGQEEHAAEMPAIVGQLDYSIEELRRISRNMMPESLLSLGLVPALKDLCAYMGSTQQVVKFQTINLRDEFDKQFMIAVYRIVQELLTNAVKHAKATVIIVQCSEMDHWLFLTVEDDGVGVNQQAMDKLGSGLNNVNNRVKLLDGSLEIDSIRGQGTTIHIQIPIQ